VKDCPCLQWPHTERERDGEITFRRRGVGSSTTRNIRQYFVSMFHLLLLLIYSSIFFVFSPIYLSICLPIYLYICLSLCFLSMFLLFLLLIYSLIFFFLSIYLSIYLSVYPSSLSNYIPIYPPTYILVPPRSVTFLNKSPSIHTC
jgi:hypothetical protein